LCFPAGAYSLLTHEQLIDLTWKQSIVPLLLSRYPTLTPAQLEHARAYAYGGCIIQDVDVEKVGAVFGFRGLNFVVELVGIALPPMKWREPVTSLVG
jgi:hypothetical protein